MPEYAFRARTETGAARAGRRSAESPADLLRSLRADGLVLVDAQPAGDDRRLAAAAGPGSSSTRHLRMSSSEILLFTFHLKTMLEAGFPLLVGLHDLEGQTRNRSARRVIRGLSDSISGGASFADALDLFPGAFSSGYRGMVRAGESTGRLVEALEEVHGWLEWRIETGRQIRQIMTYPSIVLTALLGLTVLTLAWVVPRFLQILEGTATDLPLPTRILVHVSGAVTRGWPYILLGAAVLVAGVVILRRVPSTRLKSDRLILRVPVLGGLLEVIGFSQIVHSLGSGVEAGLGLPQTLEITAGIVDNRALRSSILTARNLVIGGESLSEAVAVTGIFPGFVQRMISIGENTGSLADTMRRARTIYDRELQRMIKRITSLIEPALTVFLGVGLLFLLLSILLPLYKIYETAGGMG